MPLRDAPAVDGACPVIGDPRPAPGQVWRFRFLDRDRVVLIVDVDAVGGLGLCYLATGHRPDHSIAPEAFVRNYEFLRYATPEEVEVHAVVAS